LPPTSSRSSVLAEYPTDAELVELLRALRGVMAPGGSLDVYRNARFLARVFNLRHHHRTARQMSTILESVGFRIAECVVKPAGVHPIITAVNPG
jgi:hypothetical protein